MAVRGSEKEMRVLKGEKMKIWVSRVTPQGLHYMESVTVRSRRKRCFDLDKVLYTATFIVLYVMTAVLCFAVVPMAWALWQEVLR